MPATPVASISAPSGHRSSAHKHSTLSTAGKKAGDTRCDKGCDRQIETYAKHTSTRGHTEPRGNRAISELLRGAAKHASQEGHEVGGRVLNREFEHHAVR